MARYDDLMKAKEDKKDEFYTQYEDIQKEMNAYLEYDSDAFKNKVVFLPCDDPEWSNFTRFFAQNFENLKLRKLISTSYAYTSNQFNKQYNIPNQITMFEFNSPQFDVTKSESHGKIFILDRDNNFSGKIDINDLEWKYLEGDGDFRSEEVKKLRDEADIIATNPPFSLFEQFIPWIMEAQKKFIILGNIGGASYKRIFPYIKSNKIWLGCTIHSGDREFRVPKEYPLNAAGFRVDENGNKYIRVKGVRWFTNMEHGRRHRPLNLMTTADNLKFSKHKEIQEFGYTKYDNLDAIEVNYYDAIPSDYDGMMGVAITFLDFYCPEQFELVGIGSGNHAKEIGVLQNYRGRTDIAITRNGKSSCPFSRVIIRRKK